MATMSEEFLEWAVQQEEGIIISAGFNPDAKPFSSRDEDLSGSTADQPGRSKGNGMTADLTGNPERKQPAIVTRVG